MKNKRNIAFIVSHVEHSPQWEWFVEVLSSQYNIIFIIIGNPCPLSEAIAKMNVRVYTLPHLGFFSYFINIFRLIKIFKRHFIEIVQTEMPAANFSGLIAAYLCGIKKRIPTASNVTWFLDFKSTKQKWIDIITYYLSSHIIAQTELSREFIIQYFHVNPSKITTIHHAYKPNAYDNITEDRIQKIIESLPLSITNDMFIIGMVARFEAWKGHQYAIEAMKEVKLHIPNAKLLIFGDGPEKANLEMLIDKLQLKDTVYLCGFVKDILALYKIFHIHVHTPVDAMCETFGITILDGMMSKVPQILTKSGIAYYTAEHLKTCWLVPYRNAQSIAEAIIHLYENKSLREQLANNAYNLASKEFSLEKKLKKHIELYQKWEI